MGDTFRTKTNGSRVNGVRAAQARTGLIGALDAPSVPAIAVDASEFVGDRSSILVIGTEFGDALIPNAFVKLNAVLDFSGTHVRAGQIQLGNQRMRMIGTRVYQSCGLGFLAEINGLVPSSGILIGPSQVMLR
jgi:hypothetical protein